MVTGETSNVGLVTSKDAEDRTRGIEYAPVMELVDMRDLGAVTSVKGGPLWIRL